MPLREMHFLPAGEIHELDSVLDGELYACSLDRENTVEVNNVIVYSIVMNLALAVSLLAANVVPDKSYG